MSRVRILTRWSNRDKYGKMSSRNFSSEGSDYRIHAVPGRPEVGESFEVLAYVEVPKGHKCEEQDLRKLKDVIKRDSDYFKIFEGRLKGREEKILKPLIEEE